MHRLKRPKALTLEQVQKAIIDAGIKQTWIMTPVKPGEMLGEFNVQSHQIHVLIPYTTKNYSILYKDSSNLATIPRSARSTSTTPSGSSVSITRSKHG